MATDRDIEQFIGDSFSSIWDLELLSLLLEDRATPRSAAQLVERMRASDLVVDQGINSLVAVGLATLDNERRLVFQPVNDELADCAVRASEFYRRFPGRTRRLMIAKQSPGLTAFADAFRLRKE